MKTGEKRAIPVGEKCGACVDGVWDERDLCGWCVAAVWFGGRTGISSMSRKEKIS
jgi:hypothetical protein